MRPQTSKTRLALAIAVGSLVLGGLYVRLAGLREYFISPDEAMTLLISGAGSLGEVVRAGMAHPHPPLRYVLLHFLGYVSEDYIFLKSIAYVPGILIVPLLFLIGRKVSGPTSGLVMALMGSFGYASILLSQVLRAYMLGLFLQVLGLYFFVSYLETRRMRTAWAYSFAMALGLCAHYSTALVAAAIGAAWILGPSSWRARGAELGRLALVHAPIAALACVSYFLHVSTRIEGETWDSLVGGWLAPQFPDTASGFFGNARRLCGYLTFKPLRGVVLAAHGLGLIVLWRRSRVELVIMAVALQVLAVVLALLEKYPFGPTRQSIYLLPVLALTVGATCQLASDRAVVLCWRRAAGGPNLLRRSIEYASLLAAPLLVVVLSALAASRDHLRRYDVNARGELPVKKAAFLGALQDLAEHKAADDVVVVDGQTGFSLTLLAGRRPEAVGHGLAQLQLDGSSYLLLEKAIWDDLGSGGPWFLDSEELVRAALEGAADLVGAGPTAPTAIWLLSAGWGPTQKLLAKGAFDQLIEESRVDEDGGVRVYKFNAGAVARARSDHPAGNED